jgi:hypothetical protein
MSMDAKETVDFQNALKPWIRRAKDHINKDPDLVALMRRCMNDDGDVRVVHYIRAGCITIQCCDYAKGEIFEIFRQYLVPSDAGGFTLPEDAKVH